MAVALSVLNRFSIFSLQILQKICSNFLLKISPHFICVATLPCEILMSENERQSQTNAVINDKLQGSVAANLRCGEVVSNQIKIGCLEHFVSLTTTLLKVEESARHNPPFCPYLHKIFTDFRTFFTGRLSNKHFLIRLLKIPPHSHLKHVTTVIPCNLSLITALVCDYRSFSDITVSQGSAVTHMRCGGIFDTNFTGESDGEKTSKIS